MGVPKKKKTSTKIRRRQHANMKLVAPEMVECPHCHKLTQSHHVCPSCGYYEDRHEVEVVVKEHKKKMPGR
jgi:large subunit ribosomal protein L32